MVPILLSLHHNGVLQYERSCANRRVAEEELDALQQEALSGFALEGTYRVAISGPCGLIVEECFVAGAA